MWLEPSEQRRVVDVDINSSRCCYQDVSFFFFKKIGGHWLVLSLQSHIMVGNSGPPVMPTF